MADKKISALTAATTPLDGTEVLPIVQSGATVKVTNNDLRPKQIQSNATSGVLQVAGPAAAATRVMTTPDANFTVARTDAAQSFNGTQTIKNTITLDRYLDATEGVTISTNTGNAVYNTFGGLNHVWQAAGTERMRLSAVGIVTMSAYGAGAATFSSAGVISSVSDETWKIKDGIPVDPDFMLNQLAPGYWFYNEEKGKMFGKDRQLGFYAQNVNKAIGPEAAPIPEEGKPWGYYDRSVLAVTVMSLQKALATIESLTARITALEAQIPA